MDNTFDVYKCEQVSSYVTSIVEVVLDTFAGSGVVGETCLNMKRNCILIENDKENIVNIKKRSSRKENICLMLK